MDVIKSDVQICADILDKRTGWKGNLYSVFYLRKSAPSAVKMKRDFICKYPPLTYELDFSKISHLEFFRE